jgi:phage tail-like protein
MSSYFDKNLIDLLPDIYRENDETGDLETFLKIPAATFDEIKHLIDRFPEIFDVDRCEDRFLPFLGEIVGHRFDPLTSTAVQRRLIREAIEIYRRKGTIPAVGRSLSAVGWQGRIDETFHKALRLNRRSTVGRAKLPGMIYSLGVYRIESDNIVQGIRSGLDFHHPAGTRVFFLQWLSSLLSMASDFEAVIKKVVECVCLEHLHETYVVNHNALNNRLSPDAQKQDLGLVADHPRHHANAGCGTCRGLHFPLAWAQAAIPPEYGEPQRPAAAEPVD